MKIQSFSTHPHADGKTGEVLLVAKHFWSFTGKRHDTILQIAKLIWKENIYSPLEAEIFTVAAELQAFYV